MITKAQFSEGEIERVWESSFRPDDDETVLDYIRRRHIGKIANSQVTGFALGCAERVLFWAASHDMAVEERLVDAVAAAKKVQGGYVSEIEVSGILSDAIMIKWEDGDPSDKKTKRDPSVIIKIICSCAVSGRERDAIVWAVRLIGREEELRQMKWLRLSVDKLYKYSDIVHRYYIKLYPNSLSKRIAFDIECADSAIAWAIQNGINVDERSLRLLECIKKERSHLIDFCDYMKERGDLRKAIDNEFVEDDPASRRQLLIANACYCILDEGHLPLNVMVPAWSAVLIGEEELCLNE